MSRVLRKKYYDARPDPQSLVILTRTRWQNRRAVIALNLCFNRLKVKQHPVKTFIGKIESGFDFLGYHFSRQALELAHDTVKNHVERLTGFMSNRQGKKPPPKRWLLCWVTMLNAGSVGAQQGLMILHLSKYI